MLSCKHRGTLEFISHLEVIVSVIAAISSSCKGLAFVTLGHDTHFPVLVVLLISLLDLGFTFLFILVACHGVLALETTLPLQVIPTINRRLVWS